jgi:hypothetical protein
MGSKNNCLNFDFIVKVLICYKILKGLTIGSYQKKTE